MMTQESEGMELPQDAQEAAGQQETDFAALDDAQFLAQDAKRQDAPQESADGKSAGAPENGASEEKPDAENAPEIDYAAFHQKIMGQPIRANGGELQLRSAEEVVQLMQMGANYTRKMQELAPHRKALAMLQEHGLLDAQKLEFLVALDKKDPDAIKKYLADGKIDLLEMDTDAAPDYQGGKYAPDERHIQFTDALQQVSASPQGAEFLAHADAQWDAQTKQSIYDNPDVLPILLTQKQSGVYDLIAGEIGRQKTLGQLPGQLSFIEAYQRVGAQLHQSGAFEALHGAGASPVQQAAKQPAQSIAAPKKPPPPAAGANAAAAAISRGASAGAAPSAQDEEMLRAVAQMDDAQFRQKFRL